MRLKRNSRYSTLEDAIFDSRIPLRSEEEFHVGITFTAKLVGCANVPRPSSRMEIVTSMRRIRSDCRTRKDKKKKIILIVSYDGVKLNLPSGKKSTADLTIAHHPIHRIFYVSHDSLDLHIFSYIAREGSVFRCFVFKAIKQSMAVNIVRTIGQAFELCQKMTTATNTTAVNEYNVNKKVSTMSRTTPTNIDNNNDMNVNLEKSSEINNESEEKLNGDKKFFPDNNHKRNNNDFDLNMKQMIQDVDSKLDKLADKIEILEKHIAILLSTIELQQHDESATRLFQKPIKSLLLEDNQKLSAKNSVIISSDDEDFSSVNSSNNNSSTTSQLRIKILDKLQIPEWKKSDKKNFPSNRMKNLEVESPADSNDMNSPDSLLSSPVRQQHSSINTNDNENNELSDIESSNNKLIIGSCLLFNDLY